MNKYPKKFIKGIPNKEFTDEFGYPTASLIFSKDRDNHDRPDGLLESSINWHDDEKSLNSIFDQKKAFFMFSKLRFLLFQRN